MKTICFFRFMARGEIGWTINARIRRYIKYNRTLMKRYNECHPINSISLKDIDDSNEWLMGKMEDECATEDDMVFEGDDDARASTTNIGNSINAYKLKLPDDNNILPTFNVKDLGLYHGEDLRASLFSQL